LRNKIRRKRPVINMNKVVTLIAVTIALFVGWLFFVNQGPDIPLPENVAPTTEDGVLEDEIISVVDNGVTFEETSQETSR